MIGGLGITGLGLILGLFMGGKPRPRGLVTASPAAPAIGPGSPPQNPPPKSV